MTTVAQKQADLATLLDDIANTATAETGWNEPDSDIVNDGANDNWHNNARLLEHTNAGVYLLLFIAHNTHRRPRGSGGDSPSSGLRAVWSSDWDATNDHPAGNTNVHSQDPFYDSVGFDRGQSYTSETVDYSAAAGLYPTDTHLSGSRTEARTKSVTYFLSATGTHLSVGAWDTNDGNNGQATALCFEYLDQKFWDDGEDPFAISVIANDTTTDAYGYNSIGSNSNSETIIASGNGAMEYGDWGIINPDSADDTFFFRRPTVYQTASKTVPVSFFRAAIPNDPSEGGAHGDIVTYDATDHRMMQQSGAGSSNTVSIGLKYV